MFTMNIPLCKTKLTQLELREISSSLKTGWLTHGKKNIEFENNFKKLIGTKYALSMNSCTSALECSLKSQNINGEVIVPSWTWVSTINAVLNANCIPVFADVEINSRNITAEFIKKKITKKTKAVIIVHYAGYPCDMSEIIKLCKKKKLILIEDSAETLGATFNGKQTGAFGTGCFSFFPTKNITTTEGGMLTTNDKNVYLNSKKLIAHGILKKDKKFPWKREALLAGHNFRLPNHLAALGILQLRKLKTFNKKRNLISKKYNKFLSRYSDFFEIQEIKKGFTHSYQMYTVLVKKNLRNNLVLFLRSNGIEASVHFDPPLHKQKYCKKYFKGQLPNTEFLAKSIMSLPIYPTLKDSELKFIFKKIRMWISKIKH